MRVSVLRYDDCVLHLIKIFTLDACARQDAFALLTKAEEQSSIAIFSASKETKKMMAARMRNAQFEKEFYEMHHEHQSYGLDVREFCRFHHSEFSIYSEMRQEARIAAAALRLTHRRERKLVAKTALAEATLRRDARKLAKAASDMDLASVLGINRGKLSQGVAQTAPVSLKSEDQLETIRKERRNRKQVKRQEKRDAEKLNLNRAFAAPDVQEGSEAYFREGSELEGSIALSKSGYSSLLCIPFAPVRSKGISSTESLRSRRSKRPVRKNGASIIK